jgi:hypothetical protein
MRVGPGWGTITREGEEQRQFAEWKAVIPPSEPFYVGAIERPGIPLRR